MPAALIVWQPAQDMAKISAPRLAVTSVSEETDTPSLPQAARRRAQLTAAMAVKRGRTRAASYFSPNRMAPTDSPSPSDGAVSPEQLRSAMSRFPTGVTVITALTGDGPSGLAANAVTSLSLDPPLMLACVDRGSRTLRALEEAGRFGVNVLGGEFADLAVNFGRKLPTAEKWLEVGWADEDAVPVLDAAIVAIGCELRDVISGGDHMIVTGEVRSVIEREGEPLLFHEGSYRPL